MFAAIHVRDCAPEAHASLLDCAGAFSPRVENTQADVVVLDITGLDRIFGSYSKITGRLLEHLAEFQHQPNIAVAANPDAAVIAARGIAGVTVIPPGKEAARLNDLNVNLLPIDAETHEILNRWGIRTLGALAKLPVKQLSARLGQTGAHLHKLARGAAIRPLIPQVHPLHFEEAMELDDSIETLEPLTFILNRLLEQLFGRIRRRGLAATSIHLQLQCDRPNDPVSRRLNLPFPVQNPKIVAKLFMLDLEAQPPGASIIGVRVEATPAKPRRIQNGLFIPLSPEPEKLELTLARIATVVGDGNVGAVEIADTHARERFRVKRFGPTDSQRRTQMQNEPNAKKGIALRLFRPTKEATVQLRNGTPIWIAFSGWYGAIETASGPWKGSGDWWNAKKWDREEWDIETFDGALLRIVKDCASGRWYAEGAYD